LSFNAGEMQKSINNLNIREISLYTFL